MEPCASRAEVWRCLRTSPKQPLEIQSSPRDQRTPEYTFMINYGKKDGCHKHVHRCRDAVDAAARTVSARAQAGGATVLKLLSKSEPVTLYGS